MTSLIEKTISVIAPHCCILCSKENNVLCAACAPQVFGDCLEVCALCNKPTVESRICKACKPTTALGHVWMAASYEGPVKELIRAYKFERVRAAYRPLAAGMCDALPYLGANIIVVHIPTAHARVRQRGYDHARLLAREIALRQKWTHQPLLRRRQGTRQVGATRAVRLRQATEAFEYAGGGITGAHVLLIDDVTTSGATLTAAARLLADAGAARIDALVVAKHRLD